MSGAEPLVQLWPFWVSQKFPHCYDVEDCPKEQGVYKDDNFKISLTIMLFSLIELCNIISPSRNIFINIIKAYCHLVKHDELWKGSQNVVRRLIEKQSFPLQDLYLSYNPITKPSLFSSFLKKNKLHFYTIAPTAKFCYRIAFLYSPKSLNFCTPRHIHYTHKSMEEDWKSK